MGRGPFPRPKPKHSTGVWEFNTITRPTHMPIPEAITYIDPATLPDGAVVVLTVPDVVTAEQADALKDAWLAATGVRCVVLAGGIRVAKIEGQS